MTGMGYYGIEMKKGETDRDLLIEFAKYCKDNRLSFGITEITRVKNKQFGMIWWNGSTRKALETLRNISTRTSRDVLIGKKNVFGNDDPVHLYHRGKIKETLNPHKIVTIYTAL